MIKTEKKCGIYETYPKRDVDKEGGLRIQGIYKESTEEYPLITYVTVVYNRKNTLMDCMNSVWSQDYPNIEYIVVDGASTDGTLELIEQNADKIDYYISQPDKGIYDAMNKGIALARGKFICFMNSDDQCMPEAAKNVADIYGKTKADIICGGRELAQNGKHVYEAKYPRYCIKRSVFRYVQMFHQSTYASSQVFDTVGYFDKKYSLLADWIWESKAIDAGFDICFVEEELARFSYDGASCQGIYQRDREWEEWAQRTFPGLEERDAVFFLYCLDRGRHPLFDMNMTNKVAFKYLAEKGFIETYYATVLSACREQCTDIMYMGEKKEAYINKKISRYKLDRYFGIKNLPEMIYWLENELSQVCNSKVTMEISRDQLEKLVPIRRCLNVIFYSLYVSKEQGENASKIDRLLRLACHTLSILASRSVICSRKFYPVLRAVWYYSFKARYVEN